MDDGVFIMMELKISIDKTREPNCESTINCDNWDKFEAMILLNMLAIRQQEIIEKMLGKPEYSIKNDLKK